MNKFQTQVPVSLIEECVSNETMEDVRLALKLKPKINHVQLGQLHKLLHTMELIKLLDKLDMKSEGDILFNIYIDVIEKDGETLIFDSDGMYQNEHSRNEVMKRLMK